MNLSIEIKETIKTSKVGDFYIRVYKNNHTIRKKQS